MFRKPSVEVNRTMFIAYLNEDFIDSLFVTHESRSSETLLLDDGRVIRAKTKNHVVFNDYDFALLALKEYKKEFDEERKQILSRLSLRERKKEQ